MVLGQTIKVHNVGGVPLPRNTHTFALAVEVILLLICCLVTKFVSDSLLPHGL